jgi:putative tricarboxylic transport membrane protein
MLEDNFSRATQIYDGIGFVWERPMTSILLIISILMILVPIIKSKKN